MKSTLDPLHPKIERLQLLPDESFRLLRWNDRDVTDVAAIGTDGKSYPFKGAGDAWHCHPGMELVLVTRGNGTRFVGDSITGFKGMDLVLLGSNLPHYWHSTRPLSGYAIQFGFEPEHPFWKFPETKELGPLWKSARRGIQFTGRLPQQVAGLLRSMIEQGGLRRLALFLNMLELLARASDDCIELLSQKCMSFPQRQCSYLGIQKSVHLILNSYHQDLDFSTVLGASGMSKATFERQFKNHTGKTFTQFLTEVRIDSARRQLIESLQSIAEIAYASGFNSVSHFNHLFSTIHRETPSAFRKRMRTEIEMPSQKPT